MQKAGLQIICRKFNIGPWLYFNASVLNLSHLLAWLLLVQLTGA